jgi:hypothetical protein
MGADVFNLARIEIAPFQRATDRTRTRLARRVMVIHTESITGGRRAKDLGVGAPAALHDSIERFKHEKTAALAKNYS